MRDNGSGTLMRYFFVGLSLSLPKTGLAFGIGHSTPAAGLVFASGSIQGVFAGGSRAAGATVSIAVIATAAKPHLAATTGTME